MWVRSCRVPSPDFHRGKLRPRSRGIWCGDARNGNTRNQLRPTSTLGERVRVRARSCRVPSPDFHRDKLRHRSRGGCPLAGAGSVAKNVITWSHPIAAYNENVESHHPLIILQLPVSPSQLNRGRRHRTQFQERLVDIHRVLRPRRESTVGV